MHERRIPPIVQEAWASRRGESLARRPEHADGPPIEALVFDAYGTLFDVRAIEAACAVVTAEAAPFAALWRAKQLEYSWLRTIMGKYADFAAITAEALDHTLARHGLAPEDTVRRGLLDAWLTLDPFPEVPAALDGLRDLPLGILSNGSPAMLRAVLTHSGLTARFGAVLSVDAVVAYKPDPRVYALAPAEFGLPAERILFVSANAWDAVGATAAGFQVAWCNRAGLPFDTHGPAPDLELRSLARLPDLLVR